MEEYRRTRIVWMTTTAVLLLVLFFLGSFRQTSSIATTPVTAVVGTAHRSTLLLGNRVTVLETLPHDANAWTQGFVTSADGAILYEGTGLYGQSNIRKIDVTTGQIIQQSTTLPEEYFGEGIALYQDDNNNSNRIIQLTWKEQTGFIYDSETLEQLSSFSFTTKRNQGWGITARKNTFIVSDGSRVLHIWDKSTLKEIKRVRVGQFFPFPIAVPLLNELEYDPVSDTVLANVLGTKRIVRIHPDTGRVLAQYNLRPLYRDLTEQYPVVGALNGIALVPGTEDQYWVTGKLWPKMYKVQMEYRSFRNNRL